MPNACLQIYFVFGKNKSTNQICNRLDKYSNLPNQLAFCYKYAKIFWDKRQFLRVWECTAIDLKTINKHILIFLVIGT